MTHQTRREPLLDAGRGIAALLVAEHHLMINFGDRLAELLGSNNLLLVGLQSLSDLNSVAVQLFFFLSGLSICLALEHARTASGTIDISPTADITATVNGDSLRKLLNTGLLYVNVHSVNFGGGEIRGQIVKQ